MELNTYSKMMSFIGYINNTIIKHMIYFNSLMISIDEQITNIVSLLIHVFTHDRGAGMLAETRIFFPWS